MEMSYILRQISRVTLCLLVLVLMSYGAGAAKTEWESLDSGLDYTFKRVATGKIHAFKVNPKQFRMGIVTADKLGQKSSSVKEMAKKAGAIVAINGGFFSPEYQNLGLLIDEGKIVSPLKNTSWWSVFYVKNGRPYITHTNSFNASSSVSMAVQSGPRLVVDGAIPKLKPSVAERSAICVTSKKEVVLIATENVFIQPTDLAEYLRKPLSSDGLGCQSALNLDGGSSTQIYAKVGSFNLDVSGFNRVTNAVVVYPKK